MGKTPVPVALSKTAPVAQVQAERFLFLVERDALWFDFPVSALRRPHENRVKQILRNLFEDFGRVS